MLNPAQRAAVEHGDGPLLVLACAGTGKTRVLIERIAVLVERGADPARILAITFTNKAAGEIRARLAARLGDAAAKIWAGTFHAIAARFLRRHPDMIGTTDRFTILDDGDSKALVKAVVREAGDGVGDVDHKDVHELIINSRERGLEPKVWARTRRERVDPILLSVTNELYPAYVARLARTNAVDFPGLLLGLRDLVRSGRLSETFDHVLVDEYQDVNGVQVEVSDGLARKGRNLTAVGDDQQAIYSFRGSQVSWILDFPRRWDPCTVVKLEENYRSAAPILTHANTVIAFNEIAETHRKNLIPTRAAASNGTLHVQLYKAKNEWDEAQRLARKVTSLIRAGVRAGDCAVLYRTNQQSRPVEQELSRAGIPYVVTGGLAFWERAEVKDAVAYLRLADNPHDDAAFRRVVNVPARKLGDATMDKLAHISHDQDVSLWRASELATETGVLSGPVGARLAAFRATIRAQAGHWARAEGTDLAGLANAILDGVGYDQHLAKDPDTARDRRANLDQLLDLLAEHTDLPAFLEQAALLGEQVRDQAQDPGGQVQLMTIHTSKGLEFRYIFAVGWEEGLFPSPRADLDEERRLAYVAITRAKDVLYVGWCQARRGQERRPSQFLAEAGF